VRGARAASPLLKLRAVARDKLRRLVLRRAARRRAAKRQRTRKHRGSEGERTTIDRISGGGLMTPIAEVCVATGAALTGASPPVLSRPAGADDTTSADMPGCHTPAGVGDAPRTGGSEVGAFVRPTCRTRDRRRTLRRLFRSFQPVAGTACAALAASLSLATAACVGACAAGMGDAAPNTVFVRNLPFNVSDEQVRAARSRRAARG
jgi:hypothetical protein